MKDSNTKLLIVTFHSLNQPWRDIAENGQLKTWLKGPLPNNVTHLAGYAKPLPTWLAKWDKKWWDLREGRITGLFVVGIDRIISKVFFRKLPKVSREKFLGSNYEAIKVHQLDFMWWQLRKLLAIYKELVNRDFDYVYFANTSSYVRVKALKAFCDKLSKVDIYAGSVTTTGGTEFISGSSMLLSRELLKKMVINMEMFDLWRYNDVEFGRVAALNAMKPMHLSSTVVTSEEDLSSISDENYIANWHFRVKSGTFIERKDISIMFGIHARLASIEP